MSIALDTATADPRNLDPFVAVLREMMRGLASILPLPPAHSHAQQHANTQLSEAMRVGEPITAGTLIACTSGSTGTPKGAMLTADNLRASADATAELLADTFGPQTVPGAWLLTVPPHHIAGLQVILRSLAAGFEPLVARHLQDEASFSAAGFIADTEHLRATYPDACLYTSLVPAQLERIAADPQAVDALISYSAVLVGGAAARGDLLAELREAGARLVTTYGSSETAGGAVYDGRALPGVRLFVDATLPDQPGRIHILGPVVASGYRNVDSAEAFPSPGTFVTSDLGRLNNGTLEVLGRADGAINSGGYKILPEKVERLISSHLRSATCTSATGQPQQLTFSGAVCAVGIPHPEFGQAIGVAIESPETPAPTDITDSVRGQLRGAPQDASQAPIPRYLIPTMAIALPKLPTIGPGKVDRRAISDLLIERSTPGLK